MGYLSCRIYTTSYSNTTWTWMNPDSNWDDNFRVKSTSNFYSGSYNSHTCCFTCILFLQYACTHANSYYHQILRQACFLSHACNINKFRKTSFSCADIACRVTITLYIYFFFFKRCTFEPKQMSVNLEFSEWASSTTPSTGQEANMKMSFLNQSMWWQVSPHFHLSSLH